MAAVETEVDPKESSSFDFSSPWNMTDAVLLVEGERFNVHRGILAIWSPVFGKMFTADFKERNDKEIPLPGKKADEIRELLQVIYPTMMKPISQENCYFLLELAEEYQISQIKEKCEEFLVGKLSELNPCDILVLSQKYGLKKLLTESKNQMGKLTLRQITKHDKYQEINKEALCDVLTDKVASLEVELAKVKEERGMLQSKMNGIDRLKNQGKEPLEEIILGLGQHAMYKKVKYDGRYSLGSLDIQQSLDWIKRDNYALSTKDGYSCQSLSYYSSQLKKVLDTFDGIGLRVTK